MAARSGFSLCSSGSDVEGLSEDMFVMDYLGIVSYIHVGCDMVAVGVYGISEGFQLDPTAESSEDIFGVVSCGAAQPFQLWLRLKYSCKSYNLRRVSLCR